MLQTYERHSRAKLMATVVAVLVVAGVVLFTDRIKAQNNTAKVSLSQRTSTKTSVAGSNDNLTGSAPAPSSPTSSSGTSGSSSSSSSSGFADGSYTASSEYFVPHSNESIQVNLTLQSGTITGASIQNSENDPTSAVFQEDFASSYKSVVVGRKISGLRLDTVGGASDTTQAFNDALSQIASKARA